MGENSIGLWVRRPPVAGQEEAWAQDVAPEGVDSVTLFLNAGHAPHHLSRWHGLARPTQVLRSLREVDVWWSWWPVATREAVKELVADVARQYDFCRAQKVAPAPVELDAEGKSDAHGWGPAGAGLAREMARGLRQVCWEAGVWRIAVTFVVPLKGLRLQDRALITALADEGFRVELRPQGYSKDDPSVSWDDHPHYRPGTIQRQCWEVCSAFIASSPHASRLSISMGGIVAFQNHPPGWPDGVEALRAAHDAAHALGCRKWCYWDHSLLTPQTRAWLAEAATRTPAPAAPSSPSPSREDVRLVQQQLIEWGYQIGAPDGVLGPRTRGALLDYQRESSAINPLITKLLEAP